MKGHTMTTRDLLELIDGLGIDLTLSGNKIRFTATLDAMPPALMCTVKERKEAIIEALRTWPAPDAVESRELSDWYVSRPRAERVAIHTRAMAIRESGAPLHLAHPQAIREARKSRRRGLAGPS